MQQQLAQAEAEAVGEGPSRYRNYGTNNHMTGNESQSELAGNTHGFQSAVNARVVDNM